MAKYKRIKGGEKNKKSGTPFNKEELDKIGDLYLELDGKGIHERNPKIHALAEQLERTIRSVENQLLGFRAVDTKEVGRKNYNSLIPKIWAEKKAQTLQKESKRKEVKERKKKESDESDESDEFKFRISAQLKSLIGKELIVDDNIAIFELVKNSFDAHANSIKIILEDDKIIIWDDGKGMDKRDIIEKWLFLAYSAKKEGVEDDLGKRESHNNKRYAGAKGIGRFSADRLGASLKIITKKANSDSPYWTLEFDWDEYEEDAEDEFIDIGVNHSQSKTTDYTKFHQGTIVEISNLRSVWPRNKILDLKWSLEKLINPFRELDNEVKSDFGIEIICEGQLEKDKREKEKGNYSPRNLVNGSVRNFIFETLSIKTTQIKSKVIEDGTLIETTLIDRGNLIYKIRELNEYNYLPDQTLIHLFYLNRVAKTSFTRLMGLRPGNFGSIFLFNNGFRVFPIGEPEDDSFGIDNRKTQGYARYIGLRELIGKIEIWDGGELFVEKTSRDGGLIASPGTEELELFLINTLKKIEKFVQPILWQIKKRTGDENETIDIDAKTQIIDLIASFVGTTDIELIEYSKEFLNIIDEKLENAPPKVFDNLRRIAEEVKDNKFANEVDRSKLEFIKLKKEKELAEKKKREAEEREAKAKKAQAEAERKEKEEREKREKAEYERLKAQEEARLEREKRVLEVQKRRQRESQVRFLESVQSLDIADVLNLHHQIGIDANTIETTVVNIQRKLNKGKKPTSEELENYIDKIIFAAKKIIAVTKFTTKQNFMAASRLIEDDLILFLNTYINNIYKKHLGKELNLFIQNDNKEEFVIEFKPIELTIIIDNLLSNSKKNNAKNVQFIFEKPNDLNILNLIYIDDGNGLNKSIDNPKIIFEKGFTTSRGSGLGLFHVDKIVKEMGGEIEVISQESKGIKFIIKFKKPKN